MEMGPLFRMTPDLAEIMSFDDCQQTYEAMMELGIHKPPYPVFTVCLEPKFLTRYIKNHHEEAVLPYNPEGRNFGALWEKLNMDLFITYESIPNPDPTSLHNKKWTLGLRAAGGTKIDHSLNYSEMLVREKLNSIAIFIYEFLIVLLATQNADKTTKQNSKRAGSHAVRRDAEYFEYTTTIRIGKITESHEGSGSGTGAKKRTHLRRGHIRRQHFGKGGSEVKKIFIPPVFVNADENWIRNERKEYKILMANGAK